MLGLKAIITQNTKLNFFLHPTITFPLIVSTIVLFPSFTSAQIIPDTTLGAENSVVTPVGANFEFIDGGATRGGNLFHSFQEFNINQRALVYFSNPAGIINIFSRVTGKNPSQILGTLGVLGDANLFFLNPNGIIFGPNSRLNISGSFIGSTGSGFILPDGTEYSATNPQVPPLLTVTATAPVGLKLEGQAGMITSRGSLEVGQDLTLAGGNLDLQGQLLAGKNLTLQGINIDINSQIVSNKKILIEASDSINLSGSIDASASMGEDKHYLDNGGDVTLLANNDITLAPGSTILSKGLLGGQIILKSGNTISLDGGTIDSSSYTNVSGLQGGDINITARSLLLKNEALVVSDIFGAGNGGNLNVTAFEMVQVLGKQSNNRLTGSLFTQTEESSTGNAGSLSINTQQLLVKDGTRVGSITFGAGNAGNVNVTASESIQISGISANARTPSTIGTTSLGKGNAGDLTIITKNLQVQDGAGITTNTFAGGRGGQLTIIASQSIQLLGITGDEEFPGGVFTSTVGIGKAGDLSITTNQLLVKNGAQINTSTFDPKNADILAISAIKIIQQLLREKELVDGLLSQVESIESTEGAGNIRIIANDLRIDDSGQISATTSRSGTGGNIILQVDDILQLRNQSQISTTAGIGGEGGDGGNITIRANFIFARPDENSDITANAFTGNGGRIQIFTQGIFGIEPRPTPSILSDITASSELGVGGTIEINRLNTDPIGGLLDLPEAPTEVRVAQGCQTGGEENVAFYQLGRGGLLPKPEDFLSSETIIAPWIPLINGGQQTSVSTGDEISFFSVTQMPTLSCHRKEP